MNERRENKGMRKSVYAWFALCELFSPGRRTSTFIIIFCLFLIAITISIFGFYGESAREAQEKIIMEGYPTRITAKCPPDSLHDKSKWFNEDTMQEIRELPGVTSVFEKISMGATLKAPGDVGSVVAYTESTIPDDPGLAEQRMLWGKRVRSEDCDEIIVSETLLHRIWPEFKNGKIPSRIQLSVERGSGVNRLFTKDFRLVGIVKGGEVDDAYLPIKFMESLELWCKSAIEKLPEPGEGVPMPEIRYDSARVFAYNDVKQEELEDEAKGKNLNITLKRASEPFKETYFEGIPFLVVSRKGGSVSEGDVNRIRSALSRLGFENTAVNAFSPFSDEIISEGARFQVKIKAVNLDDVRLRRSVPGSIISAREALETRGRVLVSENLAKRLPGSENAEIYRAGIDLSPVLRVAGIAGSWKDLGEFDIICSMETMRHFTSDTPTQPCCMLWSSDPTIIEALDKIFKDKLIMGQGVSVRFSRDLRYHYGMDKQYYCFEHETENGMNITIRFIPDGVLQSLAVPGRDDQADNMPALVVIGSQTDSNNLIVGSDDFNRWAARNNIYVAGVFSGKNDDEVWLPESAMKEGIFFGRTVRKGYFTVEDSPLSHIYYNRGYDSFESHFCMAILHMSKNEVGKYLKRMSIEPFTLELVELEMLPNKTIKFSNYSREQIFTPVICNDPSITRLPFGWARNHGSMESNEILINYHDCPYYSDVSRFTLGHHKILLKRVKSDSLPPGLMVINRHFVASNPAFFFGPSRKMLPVMAEIMLPDVTNYQKVLGYLDGFSVKPLFSLKSRMIVCYNVTDAISSDGKMDEKLLPILRSERMFINVCPNITAKASLVPAQQDSGTSASKDFTLMSSYANDMTMFMNGGLKAGGWLSDTSEYQAVLPEEALKELGIEPRFIVGKPVTLLFKKDKQLLFEPSLNIETRIAGVVSGDRGYIPVDLANRISLWKEGLLDYDTDRGFIHPHEIYKSQGRIACNVYVKNIDKVRPVVAHLRGMGYETEDSLAQQEGLIRLGRSLFSFVFIVVLGTLIVGTVNILVIIWMNTRSGMFRMGILRSAGASRSGIIWIYVMMVIVIVGLAGISSVFFLGLAEPIIRNTLLNSGISLVKYASGSILDFRYWWIHTVSLLIYSTSAFIGVMFSAFKVCNLRVCELFQTRDL